jgi:hypothetical protein
MLLRKNQVDRSRIISYLSAERAHTHMHSKRESHVPKILNSAYIPQIIRDPALVWHLRLKWLKCVQNINNAFMLLIKNRHFLGVLYNYGTIIDH